MNLPKAKLDRDTAMKMWQSEHSEFSKEQVILGNIGIVGKVLKSLNLSVYDDDLYAIGIVGLLKSVNTFDEEKGYKFSTYAMRIVRNEILMTFRKKRIDVAFSLDDKVNLRNEEEVSYSDLISDGIAFEEEVIADMDAGQVISSLTTREQKIVDLMLNGKTQLEISQIIGISQSQVSRIAKGVRKKIET